MSRGFIYDTDAYGSDGSVVATTYIEHRDKYRLPENVAVHYIW